MTEAPEEKVAPQLEPAVPLVIEQEIPAGAEVTVPVPLEPPCTVSPKLLAGPNRLRRPADVLKWPLLRLEDQSKAWEQWFALAGVAAPERLPGPVLNRASMLIDAAIDGQGVALARTTLAAWDLISGRIIRPFDLSWRPTGTYWIVSQKAMAKVEKIRRFRDWLLAEAVDDAQRLRERQRHG